jgi:hypothetical protein
MPGVTRIRLLSGLLLAAAITAVAGDPPAVLGQKKADYHSDSTKKAALVRPTLPPGQKLTATQLAAHIDKLIAARLKADKTDASPRCSDEEFLRRAYLDLTGKIPTAEKAAEFLDDKDSNKRARLIDELLDGKEFGRHQADIWQRLLLPRDSDNRRLMQYYPHLVTWLEEKFNANFPWDQMVKDILTATGAVEKNGPVIYWLANNSADKVTDNASRMFLGIQLQCAQCHNHPFTDWKQDEYWGMAAFFLNVRPSGNPKAAAKNGESVSITENANAKRGKRMMLPESAKILPPKFLQGGQPKLASGAPRRPALAGWMTSDKNPFFAKAMVNRVWGQLFGRGIVNPVDDMFAANAPSHPELLADLEQQFAVSKFDVKHLFRAICNSETYQRSSKPAGNNGDAAPELFARMAIKPLSPEQMYDALTHLMGSERRAQVKNRAQMKGGIGGPREAFVSFFSAEDGADPTEYQTGIPQVLRLMNSPQFNNAGALAPLVRSGKPPEEVVEKLFLTVLARRPTAEEKDRVNGYLAKSKGDRREALAGVLWALMNSSEFALNR